MLTFNFHPFPVIETKRLIMRKINLDDKDALLEIRSNPVVNRYIDRPPMQTINEATDFIQKVLDNLQGNEAMSWVITLRGNDKMIGTIDFWRIMKEHYRSEIGYILHPDFHNMGIMSEAMEAALVYGFKSMKLHSVEANVNPENSASRKLLEKHGFVQEAYFRENFYYDGKFLDSVIYSILNTYS